MQSQCFYCIAARLKNLQAAMLMENSKDMKIQYDKLSREQQLALALEIQQECMQDLKENIDTKKTVIEFQSLLIEGQTQEIKSLHRELNRVKIELNYKWN